MVAQVSEPLVVFQTVWVVIGNAASEKFKYKIAVYYILNVETTRTVYCVVNITGLKVHGLKNNQGQFAQG